MQNLSGENFFFFVDNCSELTIVPNSVEHAYLAILNKDLDSAYKIFSSIDSPRGKWGKVLVSIIRGCVQDFPTYFQVRNFLEIDIDFLIRNSLIDYVEQVLGSLDFLSTINQEAYKFAARVMVANNLNTAALRYMEKSKSVYYNDAELHFMFANYYLNAHSYSEAEFYIKECLKLIPDYYPALKMLNEIEQFVN